MATDFIPIIVSNQPMEEEQPTDSEDEFDEAMQEAFGVLDPEANAKEQDVRMPI